MIETEDRLDALVTYAVKKGRPLSLREYRYLKAHIRWKKRDRLVHGWFSLAIGFSAIFLGGLAVSVTPFALVLWFTGGLLTLLAAETLDPKEPVRKAGPKRREHPVVPEHQLRLAELERIGT